MFRVIILLFIFLFADLAMSATVEELKVLCIQETAFDFCGQSAIVNSNMVGHSDRELRALLDGSCENYDFRKAFLLALESFERSHSLSEKDTAVHSIKSMFCGLIDKAKEYNSDWLLLYNSIERTQYMIGRLISKGCIDERGIVDILPDDVFIPPVNMIHRDYFMNVRRFRNLLLLAHRIRNFYERTGQLPACLSQIDAKSGMIDVGKSFWIDYSIRDGEWQLRYLGPRIHQEIQRFNVYIPTLRTGDLQRWPHPWSTSYSVDFEEKRRVLYSGRVLYQNDDVWRCRMENGRIIKAK